GLLLAAGDLIGSWGAVTAALLVGCSPSFLYYGRFAIHETWLVLFSLVLFVALARFDRRLRGGDLALAAVAGALGLATKETFVLTLATLAGGYVAAEWSLRVLRRQRPAPALAGALRHTARRYLAGRRWLPLALPPAVVVWLALFTSFLANPVGALDAVATYLPWGREAMASGHVKPGGYYLEAILLPYELPISLLFVGGLAAAVAARERVPLWAGGWALLSLAAYSLIPYKTPWLVLNPLLPMALVAGYGVQYSVERLRASGRLRPERVWALGLAAALVALTAPSAALAVRLSFAEYDREAHPMVYMHTYRDLSELESRLEAVAERLGSRAFPLVVIAPEPWPLPFTLRRYPGAAFLGGAGPGAPAAPVVIADRRQREMLQPLEARGYARTTHRLRPGVDLELYLAPELAAPAPPGGQPHPG
ncbi:MAG TPA: glycosyltransferase family 39 protein, partial [Thermoanaerobaculia bacterium]|nr:glycosyltransferase family 39 protein [Thermoanaerobaculia bacterium]